MQSRCCILESSSSSSPIGGPIGSGSGTSSSTYRQWDDRYSQDRYAYGTEPNEFLKEFSRLHPLEKERAGGPEFKALMLGDGEGRNGVFMAGLGYSVTSVDLSPVGLGKAKALAESRGVAIETVVHDLATFDMGTQAWGCIVGIFCHLPPDTRDGVLAAIPSALVPGGYAVFEAYTPAQLAYKTGGPSTADYMYSSDIFARAFESSLQVERNKELLRQVVEGECHTGAACVVQFIGRKPI